MSERETLIEIRNLTFAYSGAETPALDSVSLAIRKGEFVGITGPTGSGKTTLASCMNGIIPNFSSGTYAGDVFLRGEAVFGQSSQALSRYIGSVFQDPESQIVSATVEEELAFGPENAALDRDEIEKRIRFALGAVGIEHLRMSAIRALSGGQKQRVAIAAVLAMLPEIIILDEPTAELDPMGTDDVFRVLQSLNREFGMTIIVIEHKLEHLCEYCDRLIVMRDGRIVADGAPDRVLSDWRGVKELGVRLPQVTEFMGRLYEELGVSSVVPVTLLDARDALDAILSGHGAGELAG